MRETRAIVITLRLPREPDNYFHLISVRRVGSRSCVSASRVRSMYAPYTFVRMYTHTRIHTVRADPQRVLEYISTFHHPSTLLYVKGKLTDRRAADPNRDNLMKGPHTLPQSACRRYSLRGTTLRRYMLCTIMSIARAVESV